MGTSVSALSKILIGYDFNFFKNSICQVLEIADV